MARLRIEITEDTGLYDYTVSVNERVISTGECYRLEELALEAAKADFRDWQKENEK